ncbi:MAG: DUF2182 domain-containing protein [Pseudomonadota bacterium]
MSDVTDDFSALASGERALAQAVSRPRWAVYGFAVLAAVAGWVWLVIMDRAAVGGQGANGILAYIAALCRPGSAGFGWQTAAIAFSMWFAMSVAMMLPSAAPLLRTYAEIADTAARKGEQTVGLIVLIAGYLSVWTAFAVVAAALQLLFLSRGEIISLDDPVQGVLAAVILLGAGAYQFSALREACLEKCRNPFGILFARWTNRPVGVFKLGMEQGVFCLGCCWALMLVMFVVGAMNLAWMALLTLFAVLEKSGGGKVTSRLSGCILILWGLALLALQTLSF